ncbi:hypothetical protein GCM10022238_27240 [Gordonia hankookensis]
MRATTMAVGGNASNAAVTISVCRASARERNRPSWISTTTAAATPSHSSGLETTSIVTMAGTSAFGMRPPASRSHWSMRCPVGVRTATRKTPAAARTSAAATITAREREGLRPVTVAAMSATLEGESGSDLDET